MQSNFRFFVYSFVGILIAWFLAMVIDVQVFSHTNADDVVFGQVPINRTDIGERCGTEYLNSTTIVDFKLSHQGQIIFLCPQGISPIRGKVTAVNLPDDFRKSLTPAQQIKVLQFYPMVIPAAASISAPVTPTPTELTNTAPVPVAPAPAPAMSNTPPPVENSTLPTTAPAEPSPTN